MKKLSVLLGFLTFIVSCDPSSRQPQTEEKDSPFLLGGVKMNGELYFTVNSSYIVEEKSAEKELVTEAKLEVNGKAEELHPVSQSDKYGYYSEKKFKPGDKIKVKLNIPSIGEASAETEVPSMPVVENLNVTWDGDKATFTFDLKDNSQTTDYYGFQAEFIDNDEYFPIFSVPVTIKDFHGNNFKAPSTLLLYRDRVLGGLTLTGDRIADGLSGTQKITLETYPIARKEIRQCNLNVIHLSHSAYKYLLNLYLYPEAKDKAAYYRTIYNGNVVGGKGFLYATSTYTSPWIDLK